MNINDEDIDLGLALGSTYYNAQTRLNRSSGAGVNADSRVDMAFAASDPLSELVWSPHSGLKLKRADSSLPNTKPIQLWNVGLSIKDHSTSLNRRLKGSGDEKVVDAEKLTISHEMLEADGKLADKASKFRYSGGSFDHELHASHGHCDGKFKLEMEEEGGTSSAIQEEDSRDQGKAGPLSLSNGQIAEIAKRGKINAEQDIPADFEVNMEMKWESSSKISRRKHSNLRSGLEVGASNNNVFGSADPINSEPHTTRLCEIPVCSLPKVVSQQGVDDEVTSSSRDIDMNKIRKAIAIPAPNLMKLESSAENDLGNLAAKDVHSSGDTKLQLEKPCPVDKSPTNSRIRLYQEKGKAKALSDGNMYRGSDEEEDGSNNSMESCNSTGLFSKGIKRQNTDQEQLVESKRFKKYIQTSHGSTSLVKPDSSFINWISNMVNGLSDSNKEGSSSLSLTLARSNGICENTNREDIICNKHQDYENPKVGFQSMFQSLYGRNAKMPISGVQQDNCSIDESGEPMVPDKTAENSPHMSSRNIDNPCKQIILCAGNSNQHTSRNIVGNIFSTDFGCTPCASERSSGDNKASLEREKGDATPFGSLGKRANRNANDTVIDTPLPIRCMPSKSSPLSSLWITRLYHKAAKLENCHQVTEEVPVYSAEFSKPSVEFESTNKPSSPELPQTSEAMASVFAKRLDAFRHIIHPSEMVKSSTCTQICFFCGRSSHDLRTCPDLTETELDDLLVKISAFNSVGESPSFCIKCFQFDHWASSCPSVSLRGHECSQQKASARSARSTRCHIQLCPLDDCGEEDDHKEVSTGLMAANVDFSRKMLLTSSEFQRSATNSDDDLENIQRFPLFNFSSAQNRVAEGEMFHVITKLRLSRAVVLRWMDSNVSLSHLNGFFLRLRLGSSDAGLAETGYYAARITGDKIEGIDCKSKKSILVDVGGIKSSVGSQYVSNQDFLEDEIKAWWSRIVKTGGSIPSLDELNSKFKERKCLGF